MASTAGSSLRAAWRDCIGSSAPAAPTPSWQRKSRRELIGPLLNVPFSHRDLSVSADVAQRYWQQGASRGRRIVSLTETARTSLTRGPRYGFFAEDPRYGSDFIEVRGWRRTAI